MRKVLYLVLVTMICLISITALAYSDGLDIPTTTISGNSNNVHWEIEDGTLKITGEGDWKREGEQSRYEHAPWYDYAHLIFKVNVDGFRDGTLTNMSGMFKELEYVESIEFNNDINTTNVKDMSSMFNNCSSLTNLDLSNFDTANVTSMTYMFVVCSSLTSLDLSNFDTANVTNMFAMFENCSSLTSLDLSNFDTANVIDMSSMFYNCSSLTSLDLSNFDTANVTNMEGMFGTCSSLTSLDLSNFDTTNVEYMYSMFYNCSGLTSLDLSNFDTTNVKDMHDMFYNCSSLTSLDLSSFDTANVTDMSYMFFNCIKLETLNVNSFIIQDQTDIAFILKNCFPNIIGDNLKNKLNITISGTVNDINWEIKDGTLYINGEGDWKTEKYDYAPWYIYRDIIRKVEVDGFRNGTLTDMHGMFRELEYVESIEFNNDINTTNVEYMYSMFYNCRNLTSLDLSNFDTTNVTDMSLMFDGCSSLTSLDLNNFDTTNVEDMTFMFVECSSLTNLDLSNFDTTNVEDMPLMFDGCSSLTSLDLSNFDTTNVTNMSSMFSNCIRLTNLDLSNFDTANVTSMTYMFENCSSLTSLDLSNFDTTNVENMSSMFSNCIRLTNLDLSNFDTANVTNMSAMFENCRSLTNLDLSNFDTTNVEDMSYMFYNCSSLTKLDLSNFNTKNVTDMRYMFMNLHDIKLITKKFNVSNKCDCNKITSNYISNIYVLDDTLENNNLVYKLAEQGVDFNLHFCKINNQGEIECISHNDCIPSSNLDAIAKIEHFGNNKEYPIDENDLEKYKIQRAVASGAFDSLNQSVFVENNGNLDAYLTKRDCAVICTRLKNMSKEAVEIYHGPTSFADVTKDDWGYGYIGWAVDFGLINGATDIEFYPDKEVTVAEFVTMMVRLLGAGQVVDSEGTWPTNYIDFANYNNLLDGVHCLYVYNICKRDAEIIVSNVLDKNIWKKTSVSTSGNITWEISNETIKDDGLHIDTLNTICKKIDLNKKIFNDYSIKIDFKNVFDDINIIKGMYYTIWKNKNNEIVGIWPCINHTSDKDNVKIEVDVLPEITNNTTYLMEVTTNHVNPEQNVKTELQKVKKYNDLDYVDLTLYKVNKEAMQNEEVHDWGALTNNSYITISIPLTSDKLNRTGYAVHRHHDGIAEELKLNPGPNEEGFFIDEKTGMIKLKVNKFSIYTIEYGPVKQTITPSSGGSSKKRSSSTSKTTSTIKTTVDKANEENNIISKVIKASDSIIKTLTTTVHSLYDQIKFYIGKNLVTLNETTIYMDSAPIVVDNRTMLPIRLIAENFGAVVSWDVQMPNIISIKNDSVNITITLGSNIANVNGQDYELDSVPFVDNNRTYLPLRFIAEVLGAEVIWNESNPEEIIVKRR